MSDEIEYKFFNTPPIWPHNPIIILSKNGKNYCASPRVYAWEKQKIKNWLFNGDGLENIKHGLFQLGMPPEDWSWFSNQILKDFLDKLFPNGIPEILRETKK